MRPNDRLPRPRPSAGPAAPRVRLAALLLLAPVLGGLGCGAPADEELPPSIVLVSWDTVRRDHVSLYGYERETTPFLDSFAEECVVYENAYTTASFTLIAHMSMLTGLYPSQHGVETRTALSPAIPMLAQRLRDRAYYTAAVFRGGWIDKRFGYDRGFDKFRAKRTAVAANEAMREVVLERPPNRPMFLFLHLFDAHCGNLSSPGSTVYDGAPEWADRWRPGAAERIRPLPAKELYYEEHDMTPEQALDVVALYDAGILYLDHWLSEWVPFWREQGILDDGLFLLTSDHGEALGQRGRWAGHGGFNEEGLRVPLVVRFPGGAGGGTRDGRLTSVVDFVPTVLELLGLEGEAWLPGKSLLGAPRAEGEVIVAEREKMMAITDGRWKLMGHHTGRNTKFYDLAADPDQDDPLPSDEDSDAPAVQERRRMAARAEAIRDRAVPGEPIPIGLPDAAAREELGGLGYADDFDEE